MTVHGGGLLLMLAHINRAHWIVLRFIVSKVALIVVVIKECTLHILGDRWKIIAGRHIVRKLSQRLLLFMHNRIDVSRKILSLIIVIIRQ